MTKGKQLNRNRSLREVQLALEQHAADRDRLVAQRKKEQRIAEKHAAGWLSPSEYNDYVLALARDNPRLQIPPEAIVSDTDIAKTLDRRVHNDLIAAYYNRYAEDVRDPSYHRNAENVALCTSHWWGDNYRLHNVFDAGITYRCKDKFCVNCQKVLADSRADRFAPILSKLSEVYDIYHMVLTVPNVHGDGLADAIDQLINGCGYINRLFSGDLTPKWQRTDDHGIPITTTVNGLPRPVYWNFADLGYVGMLRNFELTSYGDYYHPHMHCMVVLRKGLVLDKTICNQFSRSRNNGFRLFSALELLIQKAWKLKVTGVKVTSNRLLDMGVNDGYSCMLDCVTDNKYGEIFGYIIKPHKEFFSYDQWRTVHEAIGRHRMMAGYGCFRGVDPDVMDLSTNPRYDLAVGQLRFSGYPEWDCRRLGDLIAAMRNDGLTVISRHRVRQFGDGDGNVDNDDGDDDNNSFN